MYMTGYGEDMQLKKESRSLGWLFLASMLIHILVSLGNGLFEQKGIYMPVESVLVLSELTILVPAVIYVLIKRPNIVNDLGFRPIKAGTFFMCLLLTCLILPVAGFFNVLSQLFVSNTMAQMSDELLGGNNTVILILGAFYGPFCEEFVFRSVFASGYERITGPLRAGLISGMLFALVHMNVNQAAYAFVMGFVFCIINKAAGSVYPSMIIHICINALNLGLIMIIGSVYESTGLEADIAETAEMARNSDLLYTQIGIMLVFAVICTVIAIPCVVFVAKHEENHDRLYEMFTSGYPKGNWMSAPLATGIIIVLFIMFGLKTLLTHIS